MKKKMWKNSITLPSPPKKKTMLVIFFLVVGIRIAHFELIFSKVEWRYISSHIFFFKKSFLKMYIGFKDYWWVQIKTRWKDDIQKVQLDGNEWFCETYDIRSKWAPTHTIRKKGLYDGFYPSCAIEHNGWTTVLDSNVKKIR